MKKKIAMTLIAGAVLVGVVGCGKNQAMDESATGISQIEKSTTAGSLETVSVSEETSDETGVYPKTTGLTMWHVR